MVKAMRGVLVQCDPSIKAIIMKIDGENQHQYVIEELDDQTLVVNDKLLADLKRRLGDKMKDTQIVADESDQD